MDLTFKPTAVFWAQLRSIIQSGVSLVECRVHNAASPALRDTPAAATESVHLGVCRYDKPGLVAWGPTVWPLLICPQDAAAARAVIDLARESRAHALYVVPPRDYARDLWTAPNYYRAHVLNPRHSPVGGAAERLYLVKLPVVREPNESELEG